MNSKVPETLEVSWSSSVQGELSTAPADSAGAALFGNVALHTCCQRSYYHVDRDG